MDRIPEALQFTIHPNPVVRIPEVPNDLAILASRDPVYLHHGAVIPHGENMQFGIDVPLAGPLL